VKNGKFLTKEFDLIKYLDYNVGWINEDILNEYLPYANEIENLAIQKWKKKHEERI
jgi:hypothetical protein